MTRSRSGTSFGGAAASSCIIIFCRVPGLEPAKSRLAAGVGADQADRMYRACLIDLIEETLRTDAPTLVVCHSPAEAGPELRTWLNRAAAGIDRSDTVRAPDLMALWPQRGEDLGQRMAAACDRAFRGGAERVIIVGSDTPGLDARRIEESLNRLSTADLLFGPALDGGFYLFGIHRRAVTAHRRGEDLLERLFSGTRWSQSDTLLQVLDAARELNLEVDLLEAWPDLDCAGDLPVIRRLLQAHRGVGRILAPRLLPLIEAWEACEVRTERQL